MKPSGEGRRERVAAAAIVGVGFFLGGVDEVFDGWTK